jgi:hypothetical protein
MLISFEEEKEKETLVRRYIVSVRIRVYNFTVLFTSCELLYKPPLLLFLFHTAHTLSLPLSYRWVFF